MRIENGVRHPVDRIPMLCPWRKCQRPLVWVDGIKPDLHGCPICKDFFTFARIAAVPGMLHKLGRYSNRAHVIKEIKELVSR